MKLLLWLSCLPLLINACRFVEDEVAVNANSTVVYQKSHVTHEEAMRLGTLLLDHGYFNTWDKRTVYLSKEKAQYQVTFLVNKDLFLSDQQNMVEGFKVWQQWIQEYAFGYAPTLLLIADEQKQTLYKIDSTSTLQQH